MFYAHFVLSKKGALARIWLAAHWDKKLTKAHIFETNIERSVEAIIQPQVKLALRTSGHLLLGVVRIYSRKAKYLLADCNDAIIKMKMVFRPGAVDLPEEGREAAVMAVTMPEAFYEFETFLPAIPSDFDASTRYAVYQCQPEEITLREDNGTANFFLDDGFGDIGFDEVAEREQCVVQRPVASEQERAKLSQPQPADERSLDSMDIDDVVQLDEQESEQRRGSVKLDRNGNVSLLSPKPNNDVYVYGADAGESDDEFGGEVDHSLFADVTNINNPESCAPVPTVNPTAEVLGDGQEPVRPVADVTAVPDQTTLLTDEAEAFALDPIDATAVGTERKAKRKRKLVVDEQKLIPSDLIRAQLRQAVDLVVPLDLAPPSKKLMSWKEFGSADKLLAMPGKRLINSSILKLFTRNMVVRQLTDEEYVLERKPVSAFDDEVEFGRDVGQKNIGQRDRISDARVVLNRISDIADLSSASIEQPRRSSTIDNRSARLSAVDISLPVNEQSVISGPRGSLLEIEEPAAVDISVPHMLDNDEFPLALPVLSPHGDLIDVNSPRPGDVTVHVTDQDAVFNQTLRSSTMDTTMLADGEIVDDSHLMNLRSCQLLQSVRRTLGSRRGGVNFSELAANNNRKQIATKFYTLLVLKKQKAIEVSQREPYADIRITRGPEFSVEPASFTPS